jgi:hypothetical protein
MVGKGQDGQKTVYTGINEKHKNISTVCGGNHINIYKTIILPVVLYGYETSSLTREEHRLRVIENRVLEIFGQKRDEVTGDWRKLHNEELH